MRNKLKLLVLLVAIVPVVFLATACGSPNRGRIPTQSDVATMGNFIDKFFDFENQVFAEDMPTNFRFRMDLGMDGMSAQIDIIVAGNLARLVITGPDEETGRRVTYTIWLKVSQSLEGYYTLVMSSREGNRGAWDSKVLESDFTGSLNQFVFNPDGHVTDDSDPLAAGPAVALMIAQIYGLSSMLADNPELADMLYQQEGTRLGITRLFSSARFLDLGVRMDMYDDEYGWEVMTIRFRINIGNQRLALPNNVF